MKKILIAITVLISFSASSQDLLVNGGRDSSLWQKGQKIGYYNKFWVDGDTLRGRIAGVWQAVCYLGGGGGSFYDSTLMASVQRLKDTAAAIRTDFPSGGSTSPGGSNKQFQWNNSSAFAGSGNITQETNQIKVKSTSTSVNPFLIEGVASQTADYFRITDNTTQIVGRISNTGLLHLGYAGITLNAYYPGAGAGFEGHFEFTTSGNFSMDKPLGTTNLFNPAGGTNVGYRSVSNELHLGVNANDLKINASLIIADLPFTMKELSAPATPASGYGVAYVKSDGLFYGKDDAGVETKLSNDAATTRLDQILPATGTNTINNVDNKQEWQWNSLSVNNGLSLSSTSTAAASNAQILLALALSGANATSTQKTRTLNILNTHSGTASTNVGLQIGVSSGTNNYALIIDAGSVGIGTSAPDASSLLEMTSTTQGFLQPRMTTTQMNAIGSPATGLKLFNTTSGTSYTYNGTTYKSDGVVSGSFSGVGTATTVFTVTFGGTQPNATYKVNVTPTAALSAALFYVTNKTTTTFDVTYLAGLTGTVEFDWTVYQ